MVRWPEIDDQHLSAIERLAKFRLKILTFTATFIYAACAVDLISYRSENGVTNGVIFSVGAVSLAAGITLGRIYKRKFLVQV